METSGLTGRGRGRLVLIAVEGSTAFGPASLEHSRCPKRLHERCFAGFENPTHGLLQGSLSFVLIVLQSLHSVVDAATVVVGGADVAAKISLVNNEEDFLASKSDE